MILTSRDERLKSPFTSRCDAAASSLMRSWIAWRMSDGSFFTVDLRGSAIPRAQVQSDASDQLIALPSTSPYPRNTNSVIPLVLERRLTKLYVLHFASWRPL